ncbi:MAG: cupin domain-containing protein [Steroidobacteraceae bacterium]
MFYVLAGTVSLLIDGEWTEAPRGCYVVIPGGVPHDFENRAIEECGFISINTPAGFENMMPRLVEWFAEHPLGEVPEPHLNEL